MESPARYKSRRIRGSRKPNKENWTCGPLKVDGPPDLDPDNQLTYRPSSPSEEVPEPPPGPATYRLDGAPENLYRSSSSDEVPPVPPSGEPVLRVDGVPEAEYRASSRPAQDFPRPDSST